MGGYLIDGLFLLATEIAAIQYFKLAATTAGNRWLPVSSIEEFNATGADSRAIQFTLKNGKDIVVERPQNIVRYDMAKLMN